MKQDNFFERVKKLNEYLKHFPFINDADDEPEPLDEEEMVSIVTGQNAKKPEWYIELVS